jgi:DNA-binding beta-propeller fold protein YncE
MTTNTTSDKPRVSPDRSSERPIIVKNAASNFFSVIDPDGHEVIGTIGNGRYPHTAVFHPELPVVYLLYISSAHIEVVELETLQTIQRVDSLGTAPVASALKADSGVLFIGTMGDLPGEDDPGIIALQIDSDGTLEVANQRALSQCAGMRSGPTGKLLAAQKREWEVLQLSGDSTLRLEDSAPTGREPHDIYVIEDEEMMVVNNSLESYLTVIDLGDWSVLTEAETGENPHGFAIADGPDYHYGIIPARESTTVAIVDIGAAAAGDAAPTEALIDVNTTTGFACWVPETEYAILDSYEEPHVTIINLQDKTIAGRVHIGGEPLHVVYTGDQECYVGNMVRSEIAVLDTNPLTTGSPEAVTVSHRITGVGEKPSGIFQPQARHD